MFVETTGLFEGDREGGVRREGGMHNLIYKVFDVWLNSSRCWEI